VKLVQFGAGNIGRSFVGQLFARAGWEVVFIDVDPTLVDELNRRGSYTVEVKDQVPQRLTVENVRAVHGEEVWNVAEEIAGADLVATSVGKNALPHIMGPLAEGLGRRMGTDPRPLDILIAENVHGAAGLFRESLARLLPPDFPLHKIGFVETSIGKMVPIMSGDERQRDPLLVFAESYNTLIVDGRGFKGPVPDVPGLQLEDNIEAYVDRKLFIHNMGHAVLAYTGHVFGHGPANDAAEQIEGLRYIWEVAENQELLQVTRQGMWESGKALIERYPGEFTEGSIGEHIEDLLSRFANRALGDTIYRVGRDLYRKLGPDDRLAGSLKLCRENGIMPVHIALGTACALFFDAKDEQGDMYAGDEKFHRDETSRGPEHVLKNVSGITDRELVDMIAGMYRKIEGGARSSGQILGRYLHLG
jgi:mannitol-1-phosphate 5-dehydrogenase